MRVPATAHQWSGCRRRFSDAVGGQGWVSLEELETMVLEIVADGNAQTGLSRLNTTFRVDVPQLFVEVDRTKAKTLGIPLTEVVGTLQAYLESAYVNDFNKFGRN